MATKAAASEIKNVVPEYDPEEMVDIIIATCHTIYKGQYTQ